MSEQQSEQHAHRLTPEEINRYSRHVTLPEVGVAGQEKLKAARVLCIGAGGLGSPIGIYLAAAGVGTIGVVDDDVVDISNLNRQIAHSTEGAGTPKVESIKARMLAINPLINVDIYNHRLDRENALEIFSKYDIIIDGSDNFATRYLVNDAAYLAGKPLVYGSIFRFEGQMSVFDPHSGGPCYRCLYSNPPPASLVPSWAEAGVLGVLPGTVGLIMATEAIKLILGRGESLVGRLMLYDSLRMSFRDVKIRKDHECELCGDNPTVTELIDYETFCAVDLPVAAAERVADFDPASVEVSAGQLKALLDSGEHLTLLDVREPHEWQIAHIEPARLTPLSRFDQYIGEFNPEDEIYLYCYKGKRSLTALRQLHERGFKNLHSLAGGIDQWALDVDPSMPRY